jgi:hypothetical protein
MGMVIKVVPSGTLKDQLLTFARKLIVENSSQALTATKQMIAKCSLCHLKMPEFGCRNECPRTLQATIAKRDTGSFEKQKLTW